MSDIRNCVWAFRCTEDFESMQPTAFKGVRFCSTCKHSVHLCETPEQLVDAMRNDWCVALGPKLARRAGLSGRDIESPEIKTSGMVISVDRPEGDEITDWKKTAEQSPHFCPPAKVVTHRDLVERSPLAILGYKVGQKGMRKTKRRSFLAAFFLARLPLPLAPEYLEEWGGPGSVTRRERMRSHLIWLANNAEKRDDAASFETAISEWRDDAAFVETLASP